MAEQSLSIQSLVFENAGFAYEGATRIFSELSVELPLGRNVLVTGPAGNGQSTFLKLVAVLLQPEEGSLLINGQNTTEMSFEEFQPLRRLIGYSFDSGGLFANRTLHDNMTLPLLYHKMMEPEMAEEKVRKIAERFRFKNVLGLRPASVSGGLKKTVTILRALLLKPELLVMDDPFTGVDQESAKELVGLLSELREAGTLKHVYLTSREDNWAAKLGCDHLLINKGKIALAERKAA